MSITYCDRCNDTEVLEDGYTCAKCGFVPMPEWGTTRNMYAGLEDKPTKVQKPRAGFLSWIKSFFRPPNIVCIRDPLDDRTQDSAYPTEIAKITAETRKNRTQL